PITGGRPSRLKAAGASRTGSAGKMLIRNLPRVFGGNPFLSDPVETVRSDLRETPAGFQAARVIADLDNVPAFGPPDLARVVLIQRIAPDDMPAADGGIEDA